ncbi:hypothetical protein GLOIN_2v1779312 [Rhizophagus irregularis DAOM 181602=DAOM 197198]|uniref:Uncharacterized protein n=1 Tax=Rhizophagus irregularis (strain DAOM 181602 / DAOM 197198 / MUCL 43194) TaxID=747089 RepID=A0A2P4PQA4_RHIID|nr:hypothetical protein GLOIN_2v1779312 [Rhizophagus irregularis DAOM 181602=DAOM 197198]POG67578.1 hypothetical protein GLOIN_2v1779312 [Rhizophagus irregularis DAOM 181602=DAOM 197198]GBC29044.2 hypothetical protein GLOIN_2v1779312 [Rhizophagus irregularis DAOM 181602=DAOM 197198]|eukprot:XP_025174444.1 hypothetical protein GLOIN_2v1779312 [Rhizophagus irregularis DAOM 181602=DAOM 197198]
MIKHFWNGSITVFGIKRRFEHRNVNDKYFHSIPVLAGGPGTGKSRFLDEIERINGSAANSVDVRIRKIDKIDNEKTLFSELYMLEQETTSNPLLAHGPWN